MAKATWTVILCNNNGYNLLLWASKVQLFYYCLKLKTDKDDDVPSN